MSIPTPTLDAWSNQGATATPQQLREKIERILRGPDSKIQRKNQLDIYLQGSYRNSTNIRGNSDVDIVVQCDATYLSDVSYLDAQETLLYKSLFSAATYTWADFKREIVETLEAAFGKTNVEIGNKSIKIDGGSYEADVVPCFQYRKYVSFGESESERKFIPGISFYTTNEHRQVINYPKMHYSMGAQKNKNVAGRFKPTVRTFKNLKRRLIEKEMVTKEEVPSYFLECLLYNVPDPAFQSPYSGTRALEILKWLGANKGNLSACFCQNEQLYLFGPTPEQWNTIDAQKFINQAIKLWNEW